MMTRTPNLLTKDWAKVKTSDGTRFEIYGRKHNKHEELIFTIIDQKGKLHKRRADELKLL